MYGVPEKYYYNKILNKSNFIPKEETARNKNLIRNQIKRVKLDSQIEKEDITSYITKRYNVSVIMVLNIEVKDIKYAETLNRIYQKVFKVFLIIKFIDDSENIKFGFGYKRLSEIDKAEIVLEDSFVTTEYRESFLDNRFNNYEKYFNYNNIINKFDKLSFYIEAMVKVYILDNINYIKNSDDILESKIWYSQDKMLKTYEILNEIVDIKQKLKKSNLTIEKLDYNKQLVKLIKKLEEIING